MFRPRIIPVLLLKGNGLVKTIQFNKTRYIGDPINAVKIFNDLEADELVFLDIRASIENRSIDINLVKQLGDEAYMPFAVGGGIKDVKTAARIINAGAEKVVINTEFIDNPNVIKLISSELGNQSVIVSIDLKKNLFNRYFAYSKSGTLKSDFDPIQLAKIAEDNGAGEIILNSINRDGTKSGFDLEIITKISSVVNIPIIVCGGAGSLNDLKCAYDNGAHAVAAGSLFVYYGNRDAVLINYPEKQELKTLFNK